MSAPYGIGFYCRDLQVATHGTPVQMARRLRDAGVRRAWLLVCWQDENGSFRSNRGKLRPYAEALVRAGVGVGFWGFPREGMETQFVGRFVEAHQEVGGIESWWLADPEVFYKWKGGGTQRGTFTLQTEFDRSARAGGQREVKVAAALRLVGGLKRAALEINRVEGRTLTIGVTSYGMAGYHPNFPWEVFAQLDAFGSAQLYTVSPAEVDRGIASWRAYGWKTILASVPTFGPKSGPNLDAHLMHFVDGAEGIAGFDFWSYQQTDAQEMAVVARWAERFERGIFGLTPNPPLGGVRGATAGAGGA